MRFHLHRHVKIGPVRLNFTENGFSSWSLSVGRWSWNSRTRQHTIDTPGPGYVKTAAPRRGRRGRVQ